MTQSNRRPLIVANWKMNKNQMEAEDFIKAFRHVPIPPGDSITMSADYLEYSGDTQLAYASGEVDLVVPQSSLSTDTLWFDRIKQQAYYRSGGEVVRDTSGTITSQIGRYYTEQSKYQGGRK